jgi:hypothetical protein
VSVKRLLNDVAKLRDRLGLDRDEVVLELHEVLVETGEEAAMSLQMMGDDGPPGSPVTRIECVTHSPEESAAAWQMVRDDPVNGPPRAMDYLSRCGTRDDP